MKLKCTPENKEYQIYVVKYVTNVCLDAMYTKEKNEKEEK
jgi:hypothetical protein